jgi:hypothetical protein
MLPAGYLIAWLLSYIVVMGVDFRFVAEYFKLGWTFSGGEYPTFIWIGSVFLFVASLLIALVSVTLYRYIKRAPNKALQTYAQKDGARLN